MAKRECNKCGIKKSASEYYSREGTCKECRKERMKRLYHGDTTDDKDDAEDDADLDDARNKDIAMAQLEKSLGELGTKIGILCEENTKLATLSGEINARLSVLCEENTILNAKMAMLEAENTKLQNDVETNGSRMASMDENISKSISVLEDLHGIVGKMGKDMNKLRTSAIGLSGRMSYHSDLVYEMGDAYYQFIMGNATKYDVKKRLLAKGYVAYKKLDDDVD